LIKACGIGAELPCYALGRADVVIAVKVGRLAPPAVLICLLIATPGCAPSEGGFPGAIALPTATATLHWGKVDMPHGSYCWSTGGHGVCADSPGAGPLITSGFLKPYRTAGGFDALVNFKTASQPVGFHVELQTPDGKVRTVPESAPHSFSVAMIPREAAGTYVYVVTGTWPEGNVAFYLVLDLLPGGA
jgi:hypothetical protein